MESEIFTRGRPESENLIILIRICAGISYQKIQIVNDAERHTGGHS